MGLLIINIKSLMQTENVARLKVCGKDMSSVGKLDDAYLLIKNGVISDFGSMDEIRNGNHAFRGSGIKEINAAGRFVFPSFCDSHTHIVYAGSREKEFSDKISGLSYEEIAGRGGGILNSARILHETSETELFNQSVERINEIIALGTGAVEIKSGYGLNLGDELKMLRVIGRIKEVCPLEVRSTFLGAHAVPDEYKQRRESYVDLIINEMIPVVASYDLADYIDVFCDRGFFTVEDTERILMAGLKHGLIPKLHANELDYSGGIQTGVKYNALSVDHLEYTGDEEIRVLADSDTMPTLLPGSALFLGLPDPPARKMINAGLPVALASDYNPGSSPSGNMKLIMSLGCIRLKMLPEEVINAVTINSAYAMGLSETHGSIAKGKVANVFITKEMPSYEFMPYAFGSNLIDTVILKGRII
ncbi:MAG: imidazolonepropionase [Bacteroidetes bacterium GWF2_41_9]|nr:MAG: imidazolonepropionase [Bacteroidetes bacterium GWC2_40_22]OFY61569.1 MAG: imidazolonepropionase [Bacteroidetes bacterium GWF2_41_9]